MNRHLIALGVILASLTIVHADNVVLPSADTQDGLLARLFIVENSEPGKPGYEANQIKRAMQAMKAAIHNRLNYHPNLFLASGAASYSDIITARGQFAGFARGQDGKVVIEKALSDNIDRVLKLANQGSPGPYTEFVKNAIEVAKGPVTDPFAGVTTIDNSPVDGGTFGWRTVAHADPGGYFVAIPSGQSGIIGNNKFYTLIHKTTENAKKTLKSEWSGYHSSTIAIAQESKRLRTVNTELQTEYNALKSLPASNEKKSRLDAYKSKLNTYTVDDAAYRKRNEERKATKKRLDDLIAIVKRYDAPAGSDWAGKAAKLKQEWDAIVK